jgi:gas vesicle protein
MITMGNDRHGDATGYFGWFLFGAALGAAAALLLTPKTGEQARQLLSEQGNEWARRAQDLATEAQGRAGQWLDKSRELFEEQTQRLMSAFEAGKDAMREETRRSSIDPRA